MERNYPRILQNYCEHIFLQHDKQRRRDFNAIDTKEAMQTYVKECRDTLRSLYALPKEKTPLDAETTGSIESGMYTIETVLFNSRPDFPVTANLYIPKGEGPFPCVLGTCGHSNEGKAAEYYQAFSAGLASKGFLVLIYDPIGQGERFQYLDKKDVIPGCVAEHITAAKQQYMVGEYFGTWRAWDGIRALDYLLGRSEADPQRVGLTGNSGGGTMTSIITALEDRFTMAAPSCYITTYKHNLFNELPADSEQILPGVVQAGYEEYDHITASAPRPTIILTKEDDSFDKRGSQEAYSHLRRVYSLLGRPDDIEICTGRGGHGFGKDLREAMYGFFCKHAGLDRDCSEPELELHAKEELYASEKGQVVTQGAKRVVDFTREKLGRAKNDRQGFSPEKLSDLLRLKSLEKTAPDYRILRRRNGMSRIGVGTDKNIFTVITYPDIEHAMFRLPPLKHVTLYLPHVEIDTENDSFLSELLEEKEAVFILSLRGTGESVYSTCNGRNDYFALYDADYFYSSYCMMCGETLAGGRVFDLLRIVQLLETNGYESFDLAGAGIGGVIGLYSAPFIEKLDSIEIRRCIPAFEDMVKSDLHRWPHSVLLPDILLNFDLPDIVEFLDTRGVEVDISEPVDANLE